MGYQWTSYFQIHASVKFQLNRMRHYSSYGFRIEIMEPLRIPFLFPPKKNLSFSYGQLYIPLLSAPLLTQLSGLGGPTILYPMPPIYVYIYLFRELSALDYQWGYAIVCVLVSFYLRVGKTTALFTITHTHDFRSHTLSLPRDYKKTLITKEFVSFYSAFLLVFFMNEWNTRAEPSKAHFICKAKQEKTTF